MLTLRKGKAAAVVLATVTFLVAGVIVRWDDARGGNPPAAGAMGAELRQKAEARVRAAESLLTRLEQRRQANEPLTPAFVEFRGAAQRRLAEARIDATDDPAARVRAAEQNVQQCRDMLAVLEQRKAQDVSFVQIAQGEYYVADAEYLLAKMQGR